MRDTRRRSEQRYPLRNVVRQVSRGLVKLGLIEVGDQCADCGSSEIELHHPDYNDPFHVVPLCRRCHMARHFAVWRRTGGGPVKYPEEYREAEAHDGPQGASRLQSSGDSARLWGERYSVAHESDGERSVSVGVAWCIPAESVPIYSG